MRCLDDFLEAYEYIPSYHLKPLSTDLFVQGDKADSLFILVGGELEQTDNNNTKLHLTPVHCFGEKGLTSNAPRTTTVRATKESILYRLERKNFEFACSNIEKRYAFARIPIFATLDKRDDVRIQRSSRLFSFIHYLTTSFLIAQLTYFYKHSKITSFGKGDKIVTSKEIYGQFFHVLLSGSALTENGELIEAYDFFGHEALFHKLPHEKPYDYAVTAGENVQILTLDSESFKSSRFEFVRNIIRAKAELKELKGSLQTVPIQQLEFLQDYGSGNLIGSDDDIMSSLWDAMINEPFLYFQPPPEEGSGSSNQNIREASCTLS